MSQEPSCFAKLFCCAKKQSAPVINRPTNANMNTGGSSNRVRNDPNAVEVVPKKVKESNIDLVTTIEKKSIEFREFYPEDKEEKFKFRFYCPICLRYFNSMLIS